MSTLRETVEKTIHDNEISISIDWLNTYKVNRSTLGKVTCLLCNNTDLRQIDNLRKGKFQCHCCMELKYKKQAEDAGFEYINLEVINGRRLVNIRCKKDGEIKTLQPSGLVANMKCKECLSTFYKEKLAEKNCTLVGTFKKGDAYLLTFTNQLGENKTIQVGALYTGEWVAESSRWENPSTLYCFKFFNSTDTSIPFGFYFKIGISRYPSKRLSKLSLTHTAEISVLSNHSSRFLARKAEHSTHTKYKTLKLSKETASLFTNGLSNGKYVNGERVQRPEGVTEWFYSEAPIDVVGCENG